MAVVYLLTLIASASSTIVTIGPTSTTGVVNCIPFGDTSDYGQMAGFVYNNIPAFTMNSGDTIAFDIGLPNDYNICRAIYMAVPTTVLPLCNTAPFGVYGWTKVVPLQCAGYGDSISGNYDLVFTANAAFSFAGGQLVIGISNVGAAADASCTQVC